MRRALYNLGPLRLLALALILSAPLLARDASARASAVRMSPGISAPASVVSRHPDVLAEVYLTPFQGVHAYTRHRGGKTPVPPIVRVALLPGLAWSLTEPELITLPRSAGWFAPEAHYLLTSSPDRAPPTA